MFTLEKKLRSAQKNRARARAQFLSADSMENGYTRRLASRALNRVDRRIAEIEKILADTDK